jgi:hypothetical protein
VVQRQ